jgi:N6-adenosine-specific RNA methylase IME4
MKTNDIVETFDMLSLITEPDCAIFCWAVHPKLNEFWKCAAALINKKHEFRYATCAFTWIKTNKDGSNFKGIGNYTGSNSEPCYLLVRGSMPPVEKLVDSTIMHPKMKHSQKPEEMQNRVERMYPAVTYSHCEIFARRVRSGWSCIGGEISGNDIREDIQLLANS